jgi:hypothetical protein
VTLASGHLCRAAFRGGEQPAQDFIRQRSRAGDHVAPRSDVRHAAYVYDRLIKVEQPSNCLGMDPEYTVIGRVARRIWAIAMRDRYGANERSQKLKYHIQTSGRSLHAQEMAFNDIRTTLQALCAIYDNAQSLHTNAYDEAVTTPSEESVRSRSS